MYVYDNHHLKTKKKEEEEEESVWYAAGGWVVAKGVYLRATTKSAWEMHCKYWANKK